MSLLRTAKAAKAGSHRVISYNQQSYPPSVKQSYGSSVSTNSPGQPMARESTHSKDTTTLSWKMSDVGGNDSSTGDDLKQILRKATAAALNTNETVEDFSTLPSLSLNPSSSSSSFSVSKAFSAAKKKRQARRQEKRDDSKVRAKTNAPPIEVVKASPKRSDTKVAVGKNLHVNAPHVIPIDRIEVQNGREHTLPPSDSWTGSPARNRRRSTSRGNIRRSDSDSASSDRSESYLRAEKLLKKLDQRRASSPLKSLKTRPTSPLRYGSPLPGTRVSSPLARQPASPKSPKSTTSSKQRSTSRSSVRQRGASVREKAKLFELHSETKQPPASKHVARPIPAVLGSDTNSTASSKASASKKPRAIVTSSVQPQKSNPQSLRKPSVAEMPTSPQSQPPPSRGNRSFAKPPVSSWPPSPNSSKLPAERRPADPSRSKSAPPVRPNGVQFQEQSIVSKAKELHESRKARARTLAVNTNDSVVTGNRASIAGKSEGTGTKSKRKKKKKSQKQKLLERLDKLGLKQDDALTGGLGTIVLSPSQEVGSPKNSTNPFDDDSMPDRSADKYGNSAELLDDMMNMAASRLNGTATTAGGAGDSPKGRADGRLGIKGGFSSNITRPGGELDDVMAMALDRLGGASQTAPSALQQTQTQKVEAAKPNGLTKKLKDTSQEKKTSEKTKPNLTTVASQVKPAAAKTSTEVKAPAKPPKLNSKVQPLSLPPASAMEEVQQEIEQCGSECSVWSAEFFQEPEEEIVFNQKESQKVAKPVDVSELDSILVTSAVEQTDKPSETPSKVPAHKNSPKGQLLSSPSSTATTPFAAGLASPESRTETPSPPAAAFNHPAVSPVGSGIIKALADDLSLKSGGSDKNSSDKYAVLEETTEANNSVVVQEVQGTASQRRNDTRLSSAVALIEPNLCDILEDAVLPSIGSPAIPQRRHGTPIRTNTTHDNGAATGGGDVQNVTSIYDPQSRIRRRQEMNKQTIALQGTVPPPPPPPPPRERRRNSQKPTQSADAGGTAFWSMLQTIADQDKQCSGGDEKYLPDQPAQTKGKHNTHPKANPQSPIGQGLNQAITDSKKKKSKGSKVIEKPMATISVERPDPPIFPSEKERSQDSGVGETTAEGSTIPKDDAYWDTLSTIPSSTAGHKQSVKARPPKQNQLQSPDNGNDYLSCTGICAWDDELDQRRGPRPLSAAKLQGTPGHSEDADEDESRESSAFLNIPLEISYAATDNTARVKKLLDRPTDVKQSMQALDSLLLDDLSQTSSLKYSMGTGRGRVPQVTQTASEDINNAIRRGQDMATDYELGKNSSSQDSSLERNPSRYGDDEGEDPAVTPSIAESRGSERRVPSKRVTIDNTARTEQSGRKSGKVANLLAKFEAIRTGGKPDEQVPQNGSNNADNELGDVSRVDNDPHTDLEGNLNVNLDSLEQIMSADSGDDPNLILGVSTDDADTTSLLLAVTRTEDYSVDSRLFEETSTATYSEKGAAKTELKAAASSVGDDSLPEKDTVSEAQVSKDESNEKLLQTAPSKLSVDTDTKQDTTKQTKREEEPDDVKSVEDNAQIINPSHTEEELMDDETSPSQKQIDHRMMEDAPTVSPLTIDDNQFDDKKSQGKSNLEEKKQTPTAPETNPERTSSPIGSAHSVSTQTEPPVDVPAAAVEPKQVSDSARTHSDKTDIVKLEYAPPKEPPAIRVSSPDPPAAMPPPMDEEEAILVSSASVKAQDPSPSFQGHREQSKPTSRQTKDDKEEIVPPSAGGHAVSPSDGRPAMVLKVTTDRSSDRPAPESPRTSPQRQRPASPDSQTSSYRRRLVTKSLRERSMSPTKRQPMTPESQRPPSPQRRQIDTKVATTGAAVSTTTATTERKTARSPRLQSVLDRIELRRKEKAELAKRRANLTKEKRAAAAKSPRRTSESPGSSGLSTSRRKGSSLSSPESRQGVAFHPETDFTSVVTPTPRPLVVPNRQQRAGNSGERSRQEILTHLQQPFVEETVVPAMTDMLEQYDDIVSQLLDQKLKGRDGSVMLRTKLASLRAQKEHTIAVSRSQTPRVSRPTSPAKARGPPRPEATGERMKSPSPYSRGISPGRLRSALEAHLASSSTEVHKGDPASPRRIRREPTPYRRSGRSQGDHPPAQITLPNTNDSRPRRLLSLKSSSTPALHHEAGGTRSPYDSPPRRARSASPEKIRLSSPEKNRLLGKDGDQTRRLRQQIDMARLTSQSVRNSHASLSMELLNFKKKLYAKRGERELLTSSYRAVRSAGPTPTRQRGAAAAAAASFNMSRSQPHHHQHLDSASATGAQLQHRDDETQSELTMDTASDNNFSTIRGHMLKNLKLMQDAQEQGLLRRLSQEVPQQATKQQQAVEPQMEQQQQQQQQQLLQQQRDEVSVGGFERSAELEILLDRWRQTERENERLRIANEAMKQRRHHHQQQQSHHHHHHLLQSPREGEDYESLILELKREEREKSAKVMQCWDDAKRYAKEAERPSY